MKVICTICMRGGSKGVPSKNMKLLCGKPLMAYTIEKAIESGIFRHVVVSTDSRKIAEKARAFGADCWFVRPKELATDEAPKLPAIRHVLLEAEKHYREQFDVLVDLDATSPLRNLGDIIGAYEQFIQEDADVLISACPSRKNPYFNMVELVNGRPQLVKKQTSCPTRRQDAPKVFDMNASIYIWKRAALLESDSVLAGQISLFVMPEERSIDIDSRLDWKMVELIIGTKSL